MSVYHVCCNQYKNGFFNEFSHLQHEEEFVDLTLAADGYLVKVHKNVIAIASPYLKEMLKSAASQSPVIFLNKVNHVILKYIIEYIYQGEVNVPVSLLEEFVEVAKALHINGIFNIDPKEVPKCGRKNFVEPENKSRPNNKIAAHIKINNVNNSHSLKLQKCNEPINIDSDFNDGIEEFETTDCVAEENLEYPPRNVPIDAITLPTPSTEGNPEISKYLLNQERSLLRSSRENIVENSEVQNINRKGKNLEIVIDATNSTFNITGNALNVVKNTEDVTEHSIDTQNVIEDPKNKIIDLGCAENLQNSVNSENTIKERDGMEYNHPYNISIQVQHLDPNEEDTHYDSLNNIELDKIDTNDLRGMAQYTLTQRGSPQLILNRFMYCCQFESRRGQRMRWRCIDYRRSRCPAMIDVENGKILKRTGAHAHGFHDKKIYKKHTKGLIFNTLEIAKEAYVDNPTQFVD